MNVCVFFFPPEFSNLRRPKYILKKKTNISGEKGRWEKTFGNGLAGFIEHVCQISGSYLQKTAWTLHALTKFGAMCLTQAVPHPKSGKTEGEMNNPMAYSTYIHDIYHSKKKHE